MDKTRALRIPYRARDLRGRRITRYFTIAAGDWFGNTQVGLFAERPMPGLVMITLRTPNYRETTVYLRLGQFIRAQLASDGSVAHPAKRVWRVDLNSDHLVTAARRLLRPNFAGFVKRELRLGPVVLASYVFDPSEDESRPDIEQLYLLGCHIGTII